MSVDVLASCDIKEDTPAAAIAKFEARLGKIPTMWLQGGEFPRPEVVYTYEKLLELKDHPVANCWPPYLDPAYKNHRGVFDPARWHMEDRNWKKEGLSRGEGVGGSSKGIHLLGEKGELKQKDLDRVRDRPSSNLADPSAGQADDAIILSPQRGSFLSGCQAAKDAEISLRPDPPVGAGSNVNRRVGSGRILRTDKEEFGVGPGRGRGRSDRDGMSDNRDIGKFGGFRGGDSGPSWGGDRPGNRDHDRSGSGDRNDRGNDRRDKYGFRGGWGDNDRNDHGGHRGGNNRDNYGSRDRGMGGRNDYHSSGYHNQREPEWMHEDVSITDVIVLKGFDDDRNNKNSRPNSRQSNPRSHHSSGHGTGGGPRPPAGLPGHILHQLEVQQQQAKQLKQQKSLEDKNEKQDLSSPDSDVNEILKESGINDGESLLAALNKHDNNADNGGKLAGLGGAAPQQSGDGFNFDQLFEGNLASLLGGAGLPGGTPEEEIGTTGNNNSRADDNKGGSRFSKFFGAPGSKPRSRKSSIQDELVGFIMRDINGEPTSIKIPSPEESNKYFTPISPAAKTEGNNILEMLQKGQQNQQQAPSHESQHQNPRQQQHLLQQHLQHQLSLQQAAALEQHFGAANMQQQLEQRQLQMLQQHHIQQQQQQLEQMMRRPEDSNIMQKLENGLKKSLGLDNGAGARNGPTGPPHQVPQHGGRPTNLNQPPQQQQRKEPSEMSAFNKLVAQVKQNERTPPPQPSAMPPQMAGNVPVLPPSVRAAAAGGLTEQDILEQQQRMHPAVMAAARIHQAIPPQLLLFLDQYPLNPEVLKRPEAETLMMGLNTGTVPLETLVHQLSNPNLNNRQRETFLTVLKLRLTGYNTPAGAGGLLAPHLMSRTSPLPNAAVDHLLAQPPPLPAHSRVSPLLPAHSRVSPLMFAAAAGATNHLAVSPTPGAAQRVPSPQEMTKLTQQILQQALIKKKLEEQRENYRKKQEDDKEPLRKTESAGSPLLAFTPTSVMRKTAAERKDSDPKVQVNVPELKISTGGQQGPGQQKEDSNGGNKAGSLSPGRPIKGKGTDRPNSLDVNGGMGMAINALPSRPGGGPPPPGMGGMPPMPMGQPGMLPPNLMLLANQGMPQNMLGFPGAAGANNPLSALLAAGGSRFPQQHMGAPPPHGGGLHLGPPSPRHHHGGAVSPVQTSAANSLSRFFTSDVLAAAGAANQGKSMKLPPLPTGQALTLEEIERQQSAAATVKI